MELSIKFAVLLSALLMIQGCSEKSSKDSILLAQKSIENGEYREAEIILKQTLSDNLENQQARELLGLSRYQQGDWAQAIIEWDKLTNTEDVSQIMSHKMVALFFMRNHEDLLSIPEDQVEKEYQSRLDALKSVSSYREGELSNQEALEKVTKSLEVTNSDSIIWYLKGYLQFYNNELDLAKESINQSIELNPENYVSISLLGDIQNRSGDRLEALESYSQVVDYYPWRMDDRFKRAFIYISEERYEEAQKDLKILNKLVPDSIYVKYAQGMIDLKGQNYEDAISNFQITASRVDIFPESLLYLATANMMVDNVSQSADYAQKYSAANPDSNVSKLMMANIQLLQNKFEETVDLIAPIFSEVKENPDVVKTYAVALLSLGETVKASNVISDALQEGVKSGDLYALSATILLENKLFDQAYEIANQGLEEYPDNNKLEQVVLLCFIAAGDYEKAIQRANQGVEKNNNSAESLNTLADIYRLSGDEAKAVEVLENTIDRYPGNKAANFKLANYSRAENDMASAANYYKNVLTENPRDKQAAISRFAVLAASGKDEEALDTIDKSISYHPFDLELKNALAKYYIVKGEPKKVPVLYSSNLEGVYKSQEAYGLLIRSKIELKNYKDALYDLERYSGLMPDSPVPFYMSATVYGELGETDNVEKSLKRAIEIAPNYLPAKIAYAKYLMMYKPENGFQAYTEDLFKKHADNPEVKYLYAHVLSQKGQFEQSLDYIKSQYEQTESVSSLRFWSYLCSKMNDVECLNESEKYYRYKSGEDVSAAMQLADLYMFINENEYAIDVYEKIIKENPDNATALNNASWLFLESNKAKSLDYSKKAHSIHPDSPDILDTLAYSLLVNGYHEEAVEMIDKANSLDPGNYTLMYHRADIKSKTGNAKDARKILNEILNSNKDFPEKYKAVSLLSSLK